MQKKLFSLLGLFLVLIFIAVLAGQQNVFAKATVDKGFNCGLLASDSGLPSDNTTQKTHSVVTSAGTSTLTCRFSYTGDGLPKKAVKRTGFECFTQTGVTNISRLVITPSGQITLVCQIKRPAKPSASAQMMSMSAHAPSFEMSGVINR